LFQTLPGKTVNTTQKKYRQVKKKVFVSGSFDLLHSGHVAFFQEASALGDLFVGIGSDKTMYQLKNRMTVNTEKERLFMVQSIRYVKDAWINSGLGLLDFEKEFKELKPDIFFVNEEGFTPDKQKLCLETGVQLLVSKRVANAEYHSVWIWPEGGWISHTFQKFFQGRFSQSPLNPTMILTTEAECRAALETKPFSCGNRISRKGIRSYWLRLFLALRIHQGPNTFPDRRIQSESFSLD
jgi:cytidyltransferase-like protein